MKKSKKLSLQSLALVLMSFILVAGVAFGMTGAWFKSTDAADEATITMGKKVVITAEGVSLTTSAADPDHQFSATAAMPGDKFDLAAAAVRSTETSEMVIRAKVVIELAASNNTVGNNAADLELSDLGLAITELEGWTKHDTDGYYYYGTSAGDDVTKLTKITEGAKASITVPCIVLDSLENEVELESATVNITFEAIQSANYAYANWAAAFGA